MSEENFLRERFMKEFDYLACTRKLTEEIERKTCFDCALDFSVAVGEE
jgi:hypothetical protein